MIFNNPNPYPEMLPGREPLTTIAVASAPLVAWCKCPHCGSVTDRGVEVFTTGDFRTHLACTCNWCHYTFEIEPIG